MNDYVVLVDHHDRALGRMEKLEAHQKGLLHRAFSLFVFNSKEELLLQQRAADKYHSGGLWTNTCCSHPGEDETMEAAVSRRLFQEMRMRSSTRFAFNTIYKTTFENGLTEHELDHVYIGYSDETPEPDPAEVMNWKYLSCNELNEQMKTDPQFFSAWFRLLWPRVAEIQINIKEKDNNVPV